MEAPDAIKWLNDLDGVEFDKTEKTEPWLPRTTATSRRMHAAKGYSGSGMRTAIRDEVLNLKIPVVEFTSAVEELRWKNEKGQSGCGCSSWQHGNGDYSVAEAKLL